MTVTKVDDGIRSSVSVSAGAVAIGVASDSLATLVFSASPSMSPSVAKMVAVGMVGRVLVGVGIKSVVAAVACLVGVAVGSNTMALGCGVMVGNSRRLSSLAPLLAVAGESDVLAVTICVVVIASLVASEFV